MCFWVCTQTLVESFIPRKKQVFRGKLIYLIHKWLRWSIKPLTSVWLQTQKNIFCLILYQISCFFFLYQLFCKKNIENAYSDKGLEYRLPSTQMLVKIYNIWHKIQIQVNLTFCKTGRNQFCVSWYGRPNPVGRKFKKISPKIWLYCQYIKNCEAEKHHFK